MSLKFSLNKDIEETGATAIQRSHRDFDVHDSKDRSHGCLTTLNQGFLSDTNAQTVLRELARCGQADRHLSSVSIDKSKMANGRHMLVKDANNRYPVICCLIINDMFCEWKKSVVFSNKFTFCTEIRVVSESVKN